MTRALPPLNCPSCGQLLAGASTRRAGRFEDCSRRCDPCGVGFSNARSNPTAIHRDPIMNVPAETRPGLVDVLDQALNVRNRPTKRIKFGFSTSEDAVTWGVFSTLIGQRREGELWRALGGAAPALDRPHVLLSGVPVPSTDNDGWVVRNHIERISERLGENRQARTEPDVVIDGGEGGIVIVEVKYLSRNNLTPPGDKFDRYVEGTAFADPQLAKMSGMYELVRNWRFGWELAGGRPLLMCNLITGLHSERERQDTSRFVSALALGPHRRFELIEWESLLEDLALSAAPGMETYLAARF